MTIMGRKPRNHPQQVAARGGVPDDSVDDRRTIPEVFDPWNRRYRFTLDAAASPDNAKCPAFYSLETSGLTHPWSGRVWCNPPYSKCAAWVAKAHDEMHRPDGPELVCMLLPANRCEQKWWQYYVEPNRDRAPREDGVRLTTTFLHGRPRFDRPNWKAPAKGDRPPFGLVVLLWTRGGR
jgi:phage N-6-adenine-methyltransferase